MTIKAWQGPSTIDGQDIMAVVSCECSASKNDKTGDMVQVAFMRTDIKPSTAVREGKDGSVCGDCKFRAWIRKQTKSDEPPCYVATHWMASTWKAGKAAIESMVAACSVLNGKPVRFGSYGNMSSIPRDAAERLLKAARKWTLYEHRWKLDSVQWLRHWAMASVHNEAEAREAQAMGWRTFRAMPEGGQPMDSEVVCPFETHKVQCADCLLCNGKRDGGKRKSVCVTAH